jgi:LPPG:FO 2-phospho-L-lactate transferase
LITVLAGGVGAARMLVGLRAAFGEEQLTAIVNTGDDATMWGLYVCPDLDTITYTLAGAIHPEQGWGLADETVAVMTAIERYGGPTWFKLGDKDLATHLYRTGRIAAGATLSEVTADISRAWGLGLTLLPMTDQPVRTRLRLAGEDGEDPVEVDFQDYFVRLRHAVPVAEVRFAGVEGALPAPGVLHAIRSAEVVVIAPSNPAVSIAPILAVPGIGAELRARRSSVVAVSPIVAGSALKGPADRLLTELGGEASALGVARWHAKYAGTIVIDEADRSLAPEIEALGVACVVTNTIMSSTEIAGDLATATVTAVTGRAT